MKRISKTRLQDLEKKYKKNIKLQTLTNVLVKSDIKNISYDLNEYQNLSFDFEKKLDISKITDQRSSGRCWIFSGLNVLRQIIKDKLNLSTFELSQSYLQYYDNIEKSYFIMSEYIRLVDKDLNSDQYLFQLVNSGMGDGGLWNMFRNLVKKYGIVPSYVFPDTINAGLTQKMVKMLHTTYNKFYIDLIELKKNKELEKAFELRDKYMEQCFNIISMYTNIPPKKFDFEYVDKDNKYHLVKDLDPIQFYNDYVGIDIDDYVSVFNDPRFNTESDNHFVYSNSSYMVGGNNCEFLNVKPERLKELLRASLDFNEAVWFGCDVARDSDYTYFSKELINSAKMFDVNLDLDKANSLDYRAAQVSHAMTFVGYSSKDNKVNKWLVENSWGANVGKDGLFVMSDKWFSDNVYEIIVRKYHLKEEEKKQLETKPIEIDILKMR